MQSFTISLQVELDKSNSSCSITYMCVSSRQPLAALIIYKERLKVRVTHHFFLVPVFLASSRHFDVFVTARSKS